MEDVSGFSPAPDEIVPECLTCIYFRLREDLQANLATKGAGECRRYPPKVFFNQALSQDLSGQPQIGYNMVMQCPIVKSDYFCGEHPELSGDFAPLEIN